MRDQVYSWRLTAEQKSDLERAARLQKVPVSSILSMAVQDWLQKTGRELSEEDQQRQLHEVAEKHLGAFAGRNSRRAENARQTIRARLRKRHAK
jgi:hypothetical protein